MWFDLVNCLWAIVFKGLIQVLSQCMCNWCCAYNSVLFMLIHLHIAKVVNKPINQSWHWICRSSIGWEKHPEMYLIFFQPLIITDFWVHTRSREWFPSVKRLTLSAGKNRLSVCGSDLISHLLKCNSWILVWCSVCNGQIN